MAHKLTTCTFCGVGCGLYLEAPDNHTIAGVYPSMSHPTNAGRICVRGWNVREIADHFIHLKPGTEILLYGAMAKDIVNLALVTGQFDRAGTGIFALTEHNNLQGVCDLGMLPDRLPGYRHVADDATRAEVDKHELVTH
jgi:predicted molibdopterin-dependent oxidoreductase YjgC